MNGNKNFENFFKENLNNLNIKPNSNVWKGVKSNLWYSDIQNLFYSYTIQPASNVWRIIAFKLWFKGFMVFSPKTFNIYYFSSLIIATSLLFTSLNNKTNNKLLNVKNDSNIIENNSDSLLIGNVYNNNSARPISNFIENKEQKNDNKNISDENSLIVSNLNKTNVFVYQNKTNNKHSKVALEPIIDNNEITNNEIPARDYSLLPFMVKQSIMFDNKYNNDSAFINRPINEYNPKKWYWSIEGYLMPVFNSSTYLVSKPEFSNFYKNIDGKSINVKTLTGGILVEAKHLNFSFQTGIFYSKLADKPNYQYLSFRRDSILVTQINHGGYYNYFDISILNLDTLLLTGHCVYITIHDSEFVATTDTVLKHQLSIIKTTDHKRTFNSYSYIEIPFIAGYTFSQGKINLTLRAGIIAGILTNSLGSLPSPYSEYGTVEVDAKTNRKLLLSGIAGIEVAYDVSKRVSIIASPIYRFNLTSVYNKNYIVDERFKSIGIKLGIKYKLN